jgi:hypothetical protein
MKPKEKAKELMKKYTPYVHYGDEDVTYDAILRMVENVKQCALIAVDEILENLYGLYNATNYVGPLFNQDYWQQVKQEIEKL